MYIWPGTMYKEEATDSSASYKGVGGTGAGILNYMSYWGLQN